MRRFLLPSGSVCSPIPSTCLSCSLNSRRQPASSSWNSSSSAHAIPKKWSERDHRQTLQPGGRRVGPTGRGRTLVHHAFTAHARHHRYQHGKNDRERPDDRVVRISCSAWRPLRRRSGASPARTDQEGARGQGTRAQSVYGHPRRCRSHAPILDSDPLRQPRVTIPDVEAHTGYCGSVDHHRGQLTVSGYEVRRQRRYPSRKPWTRGKDRDLGRERTARP